MEEGGRSFDVVAPRVRDVAFPTTGGADQVKQEEDLATEHGLMEDTLVPH
jgi:hypothetical protein